MCKSMYGSVWGICAQKQVVAEMGIGIGLSISVFCNNRVMVHDQPGRFGHKFQRKTIGDMVNKVTDKIGGPSENRLGTKGTLG